MTIQEMIDEYGKSLSIPSYIGWQAEGTLQYCNSKKLSFGLILFSYFNITLILN